MPQVPSLHPDQILSVARHALRVDDIGAILVVALFYSGALDFAALYGAIFTALMVSGRSRVGSSGFTK